MVLQFLTNIFCIIALVFASIGNYRLGYGCILFVTIPIILLSAVMAAQKIVHWSKHK
jgi:hypothetical protein